MSLVAAAVATMDDVLRKRDLAKLDVDFLGTNEWLSTSGLIRAMQSEGIPIYS